MFFVSNVFNEFFLPFSAFYYPCIHATSNHCFTVIMNCTHSSMNQYSYPIVIVIFVLESFGPEAASCGGETLADRIK